MKAILALKWITLFCPQASYIMKIDDDAFVNIFELLPEIEQAYPATNIPIIAG